VVWCYCGKSLRCRLSSPPRGLSTQEGRRKYAQVCFSLTCRVHPRTQHPTGTWPHLLQLLEAEAVVLTHVVRALELAEPTVRRLLEVALAEVRAGPDARHAADAHAAEVDHPCVCVSPTMRIRVSISIRTRGARTSAATQLMVEELLVKVFLLPVELDLLLSLLFVLRHA